MLGGGGGWRFFGGRGGRFMFGIGGGLKSFCIYRSSLTLFWSGNSLFYMVGPFKLFGGNGGKPIFII